MIAPPSPSTPSTPIEDDPLAAALAAAAKALEDHPSILWETTPEWPGGLNLDTINALVAEARLLRGRVGERVVERDEFGQVSDRGLRFFHPNGRDDQLVWTWGQTGLRSSPGPKVPTVVGILRAWREERLTQLATPEGDWFTLDVLEGRRRTVRRDLPGEGDRARDLAGRLRTACAEAGLTEWDADDARVARAAAVRLARVLATTATETGRLPVAVALERWTRPEGGRGAGRGGARGRAGPAPSRSEGKEDGPDPTAGLPLGAPRSVAPSRVLLSKTEEQVYSFLAKAFQEQRRPTYDDAVAEGWTRDTYSKALKALESCHLIERAKGRPVRVFPRESAR